MSQWKALVRVLHERVFFLKGKGGGAGMPIGEGSFTTDTCLRGCGTAEGGSRTAWEGACGRGAGEDGTGEGGDGMGGRLSAPIERVEEFLNLRGLGTGLV